MTVTAGGLQNSSLPLLHVGRRGHRTVDGQSHVTVWGPQTLGGGCSWCKQALTATLTNNTHICRKCSYLYQLKPSNNQVTVQRWSTQETKDVDMKKETKQPSLWQHNKWVSSQLSFQQNTFWVLRCHSACFEVESAREEPLSWNHVGRLMNGEMYANPV